MLKRSVLAFAAMASLFTSSPAMSPGITIEEQATAFSPEAMRDWKPTFKSLDDWVTRTSRKEWRLVYKKETKQDYIALFLDADQRLIVASWRLDCLRVEQESIHVSGDETDDSFRYDGQLNFFVNISSIPVLDENGALRARNGGTRQWSIGNIYVIRKGYKGKIRIVKQDKLKVTDPFRVIIDHTLQWPIPK